MQTTSPLQINRHQLNSSKSKQQYSFGKSQRFAEPFKPPCKQSCYDLPLTLKTRSTMFGFGDRSDFTKQKAESPPPWHYEAPSSLKKVSFSFGTARELCNKQVFESHKRPDPSNPGPGSYSYRQKSVGDDGPRWSLRSRTNSLGELKEQKNLPGPGNYAPKWNMNKTGQYFLSSWGSTKVRTFGSSSSDRFANTNGIYSNVPGPGTYKPIEGISKNGDYFFSRFHSSSTRTFGKSERSSQPSSPGEVPGPGAYQLPSEFGIYDEKIELVSNSVKSQKKRSGSLTSR
ncbi:unnamed protein product [Blepharisma stoltei]|uniref:Uncharacterized protein n=1 Tax=Blepharisma stoltei TaxID=1481888 RepID=A0AAU9K561_9CILI|nr:unnamed protein product [Blepharisma stoltei]